MSFSRREIVGLALMAPLLLVFVAGVAWSLFNALRAVDWSGLLHDPVVLLGLLILSFIVGAVVFMWDKFEISDYPLYP